MSRDALSHWFSTGKIPPEHMRAALTLAQIPPTAGQWLTVIYRMLLVISGLSFAASLMFFVAYNWQRLGHFAKFALAEVVIIICCLLALRFWQRLPLLRQTLMSVAVITLGVLLALIGQVYQTGADPWQLFALWAALALPWVVLTAAPGLWLLWLVIYHLALALFTSIHFPHQITLSVLVISLTVAWAGSLLLAARGLAPSQLWLTRLLLAAVLFFATTLLLLDLSRGYEIWAWCLWLALMLLFVWVGYVIKPDLLVLSLAAFTLIVVVMYHLVDWLFYWNAGTFLILAVAQVLLLVEAARVLRHIQRKWQL